MSGTHANPTGPWAWQAQESCLPQQGGLLKCACLRRLFKGLTPLWGRQIPYTMMKFGEPSWCITLAGCCNRWLSPHLDALHARPHSPSRFTASSLVRSAPLASGCWRDARAVPPARSVL